MMPPGKKFWVVIGLVSLGPLGSCSRPSSPGSDSPGLGEETETIAPPVESAPRLPGEGAVFTGDLAWQHVQHLVERIGPRPARSEALEQAWEYVASTLEEAGYEVQKLPYRLPGGPEAFNITAVRAGRSDEEIVLAAHLDTVPNTPGANDDASGIGALLELARLLREVEPPRSVRFLFLTAEESIPGFQNEARAVPEYEEHGYSSLKFFESFEPGKRPLIAAACWMDKIAAGPTFKVISIRDARPSLAQHLNDLAHRRGMNPQLIAAKRWSQEMAFEDHNIPTAWIEYGPAPQLHQPGDDLSNVDPGKLATVGALVYEWLVEQPNP